MFGLALRPVLETIKSDVRVPTLPLDSLRAHSRFVGPITIQQRSSTPTRRICQRFGGKKNDFVQNLSCRGVVLVGWDRGSTRARPVQVAGGGKGTQLFSGTCVPSFIPVIHWASPLCPVIALVRCVVTMIYREKGARTTFFLGEKGISPIICANPFLLSLFSPLLSALSAEWMA